MNIRQMICNATQLMHNCKKIGIAFNSEENNYMSVVL